MKKIFAIAAATAALLLALAPAGAADYLICEEPVKNSSTVDGC